VGRDIATIVTPVQSWYFESCLANQYELQAALAGFQGQITYHLSSHPLLNLAREVPFGQKMLSQTEPVEGLTVFTDGSGKTGKAAVVWYDNGEWKDNVILQQGLLQLVELWAMVVVFQTFTNPINIMTDSAYVANLVAKLDKVVLGQVDTRPLFELLLELWNCIQQRKQPYFVMHIRSHTTLPGFFTEGNARADALVSAMVLAPVPNVWQQAILSHQFFHQ
ncbi:POK19 protein, partial [Calyptomena viridis]|nr:POK19 protein [Calyptomena viridis]